MERLSIVHGMLILVVSGFIQSAGRLKGVRALANLAIFAASLSIAWRLLGLTRSRLSANSATRLAAVLLILTVLSGAARVGAFLGVPQPDEPTPTLLKVLAGVLWVFAAFRLSHFAVGPAVGPPHPPGDQAAWIEPLVERARSLEEFIKNDAWLLGKPEALRELQDIRAELERHQCKT